MSDLLSIVKVFAGEGGITGLVVLALFYVLYQFSKTLSLMDSNHRNDIGAIMKLHADERAEWGRIVDSRQKETNERQKETNQAINALAVAVNRMAVRRRAEDEVVDWHQ